MAANPHSDQLTREIGARSRALRQQRNGHTGAVIWLTGLSGSGKSTLTRALEEALLQEGCQTVVLDGDNIRLGVCADLGFSLEDRHENVRRVGEIARLLLEQGYIVLVALVSPMRGARDQVRQRVPVGDFIEVYCDSPLAVCQQRDPKGLYAKARQGLIAEFTGITSPYEAPLAPEVHLDTAGQGADAAAGQLVQFVLSRCRP